MELASSRVIVCATESTRTLWAGKVICVLIKWSDASNVPARTVSSSMPSAHSIVPNQEWSPFESPSASRL